MRLVLIQKRWLALYGGRKQLAVYEASAEVEITREMVEQVRVAQPKEKS